MQDPRNNGEWEMKDVTAANGQRIFISRVCYGIKWTSISSGGKTVTKDGFVNPKKS